MKINNDIKLSVAMGKSRKEISWRNTSMLWSELLEKLSETTRTSETLQEYMQTKKSAQDDIKDIGGFVGGYIKGGRRKAANIMHRQILSLDVDFSKGELWEDFTLLYDCAACVYSTHKHSPKSNRLRLVIPLHRTVTPEEYQAIARFIAGQVGIDQFDDSTYEPSRLMYWPSTAKDGEFVFEFQDGDILNADEVLGEYVDWTDTSEWPISSRVNKVVESSKKKAGDPTEKDGVIGAFCRSYDIHEAIEVFLPDTYTRCDNSDDRYSYMLGTTAGGLITYDDMFAFSHHGTDPTGGMLCNAFDLCRIHLYGDLDENVHEKTNISKYPSFSAMTDMAVKDKRVSVLLSKEKLEEAGMDFAEVLDEEGEVEEVNLDWMAKLEKDKKGINLSTIQNALIVLKNDARMKGLFAYNQFDLREIATRDMLWRKITKNTQSLTDNDDAGVRYYLERFYGIKGRPIIDDAMSLITLENAFHPIKDYFETLEWDGTERIDTLLIDYLGAEECLYTRTVMRKVLLAAVYRIFHPGHKFDNVLTLIGTQGVGKSTFVKNLGREWFSDTFELQGKEKYESVQGVWILELGELAGIRKAEAEAVKNFISKTEDRYRVAYGRRVQDFPRQCIFIGTTNDRNFLNDPTGNRRFLPVDTMVQEPTLSIWEDMTEETIDQIWAEALVAYKSKEPCWIGAEVEILARGVQEKHSEIDDRQEAVEEYLDTLLPEHWDSMEDHEKRNYYNEAFNPIGTVQRKHVTALEIWTECFGKQMADFDRYKGRSVRDMMAKLSHKWEYGVSWIDNKSVRGYTRIEQEDDDFLM